MKQLTIITAGEAIVFDLPEKYWVQPQMSNDGLTQHLFCEGEKPNMNNREGRERYENPILIAKIDVNSSFVISEKEESKKETIELAPLQGVSDHEILYLKDTSSNGKNITYFFTYGIGKSCRVTTPKLLPENILLKGEVRSDVLKDAIS